ncbi:MAG TPA: 2-isopropylmalate synthase [Armatimonadetes bacterium]|nr:2-isopropylmalate synthase [Armatimonadota bacterium]
MSERIYIFDTTLRDGEQSPGASLNPPEKLQIAHQLARLKVDVIEAGFPISSPDDFAAVQAIAQEVRGPEICGLARVREEDIERAWEAVKHAERARIHTFIATSDIHTERKLRKSREEVLEMAVNGVQLARQLTAKHPHATVEFSTEDAVRSDLGYLCAVIEAAIEAGADVINVPDTVGYAMPPQFRRIIEYIREHVPNIHQVILSVHCHNDLGLAVANSLAGIEAGVRQVECTINGLGERAGNASLEEIVMALKVRPDYYQVHTEIATAELYRTSQLVSKLTGLPVQPNKAIVGANAFRHSAGIHQDGVIKDSRTYEIMRPKDVGWPADEQRLPLSPRSGRHGLQVRLQELGYQVTEEELTRIYEHFLRVADRKKQVFDEDLVAIVEEETSTVPEIFGLENLYVSTGTHTPPTATVCLNHEGSKIQDTACGDGAVDALYKAIDRITGVPLQLDDYRLRAVTEGQDAIGEAVVRVRDNGLTVVGRGTSTDVIEASAKAYLNALNKVLALRQSRAVGEAGREKVSQP